MAISFINSSRGPTSFPGSTNNTSSVACAKPTNTANGDLMIAYCQSGGAVNHSAPAGWSTLSRYEDENSVNLTSTIFYKFASSEGSSYTFTDDSSNGTPLTVQILTYRGVDTTGTFNAHAETSSSGTDTRSAPTVSSTETGWYVWFRTGKTSTVGSEGDFSITSGTSRQKSSNRGGSTQYFVESADSNGNLTAGSHSGASFNSSVTLTGSIERTVVLKAEATPATGGFTVNAGHVTVSGAGSVHDDGALAVQLGHATLDFNGTHFPPGEGVLDFQLSPVGMEFEGEGVGGPVAVQLQHVSVDLSGGLIHGGFSMELSKVEAVDFTGSVNPIGGFSAQLGNVTMEFVGETRPFGAQVIFIEPEKRGLRITQDDTTPIFLNEVTQE